MALTLTYAETRREVGRLLAIGEDPAQWPSEDTTRVTDIIRRGSRRFYYPEPGMVDDETLIGHSWSFIQTELSVTLTADTTYHDLPSDFQRLTEKPSIDGNTFPLEEVAESAIRDLINSGSGTGDPQYYAIKRSSPSSEDLSYRIAIYPQVPSSKTLVGWYEFDPAVMSASQAPIVPSRHAETLLAAILATADENLNYESATEGKHMERFRRLLVGSILYDKMIGG